MSEDVRFTQLCQWLDACLPELFTKKGWGAPGNGELTSASSDASFRRYFRWECEGRTLIVMDAPPPQEDCQPFVYVASLLTEAGVHVPEILAQDVAQGFLLLGDLGRQTYLDVLTPDNADTYFNDALQSLLTYQALPTKGRLPEYNHALLARELQLFPDWYVRYVLGHRFDAAQQASWEAVCNLLIESALAQSRVMVHRDYMPRNLMVSAPNPGVLDFQDAVHGPITYDVTCLFKDAFLSWPEERVRGWLETYWARARQQDLPVGDSFEDFYRASDLMGVQRHLKVIGIFARICHRDGKPKYLADVPRFFAYIEAVIARRPELAPLKALLSELTEASTV
jgi:aminoglycoside/choline kinase family phosphotransferase